MSERLVLEVVDGPLKGKAYAVSANGVFVIGRLPECDLAIPQDLTVSRQHFRIEFRPPECRLIHLSQTGETRVNEVSVSAINLSGGDNISFGSGHLLRVRLEESPSDSETATQPAGLSTLVLEGTFTMSAASCGWNLYQSADPKTDFEKLFEIVGQSQKIYAIIDFRRIGQPVPLELVEPEYLFPWLPPEMRDQFSPILVSQSVNPDLFDLLRAGWGRDGIVCFGSTANQTEILNHWRKAVGVVADQPGSSMTAYYWPSLLRTMLVCQSAERLSPLLSGLTWVFVEDPKSSGNWNLYANEQFASILSSAGLIQSNPADQAGSPTQKSPI